MAPLRAIGADGRVSFDGQFVTIAKSVSSARGAKARERRIPVSLIAAVHWKAPSLVKNGFIGFETISAFRQYAPQSPEVPYAAWKENSVAVRKRGKAKFLALRDAVEAAQVSLSLTGKEPRSGEIARLTDLHTAGHLTDGELEEGIARTLGL